MRQYETQDYKKSEKAWRDKQLLDEYNQGLEEYWVEAGEPGLQWRIRSVKQIPKGWKSGMDVIPPKKYHRHLSEKSYKAALAGVRPSQRGRDRLAPQLHNKPVKHMIRGEPLKKRKPTTKATRAPARKGLTLPPGIALRTTKAAKASLFQPKGLPAPAAALPKIQPKALPKYRAAKAAKAKTPRKKAAPKPPKCVNGVVHVKAYTRKCGTKKKAATQAGKGIGSKLKTAAKIAGAAALASLAYKNRDVLKDIPRTYDAYKKVHRGHPLNTHPRIHAAKLTAMDTLKNLKIPGRGIGSKLKTAAKVTGAAALAAGLALLARHNPHLTKNIKPVSQTQGSLYFPNASPWGPTY